MKTGILGIVIVLFLVAGCSKKDTASASRDAFVGNYHMTDSSIMQVGYINGHFVYDTSNTHYNMQVLPLSGSSDKIVVVNASGYGYSDTGLVSGTLATFATSDLLNEADLSGSTISLTTYARGGTRIYFKSTGTKY